MPFANTGGAVPGVFQHVRDGDFVRMEALVTAWEEDRVHGNSLVVSPSQKRCTRSRADSAADVEVIKDHSLGSHLVKVGSFRDRRAVEANIAISHVINEDENNVGLWWSRLRFMQRYKTRAEDTEKGKAESECHSGDQSI